MPQELVDELVAAISACECVRVLYDRQVEGGTSLHVVAPLDIRPGDTQKTERTLYLWAWCFAEAKPETHILTRVRAVRRTGDLFDYDELRAQWLAAGWPIPEDWVVPREWA